MMLNLHGGESAGSDFSSTYEHFVLNLATNATRRKLLLEYLIPADICNMFLNCKKKKMLKKTWNVILTKPVFWKVLHASQRTSMVLLV